MKLTEPAAGEGFPKWAGDCTRGSFHDPDRPHGSASRPDALWHFDAKTGSLQWRFHLAKMPVTPPLSTGAQAEPASYEDALAELERLVGAMENGQLPLDQLLQSYRRGAELLQFCHARLEVVEQQVKVLEDGQLKPWMPA